MEVSNRTPRTPERTPVPDEWAAAPVSSFWTGDKPLALPGSEPRTVQRTVWALYRHSHRGLLSYTQRPAYDLKADRLCNLIQPPQSADQHTGDSRPHHTQPVTHSGNYMHHHPVLTEVSILTTHCSCVLSLAVIIKRNHLPTRRPHNIRAKNSL